MENANEIELNIKPKCVSFGAVFKRKLLSAFIPFVITIALHIPLQMIMFWLFDIETPFLTAPLFMFIFYMYCGHVFNYYIEDKYGVTRNRNFLSSYAVAAVYSLFMTLFTLGLAELCNFFKHSREIDLSILVRNVDSAVNFFYGLVTCLLMFPLVDMFLLRKQSGRTLFIILSCLILFFIPLLSTEIFTNGVIDYYIYFQHRGYALLFLGICLVIISGLNYALLKRGIKR